MRGCPLVRAYDVAARSRGRRRQLRRDVARLRAALVAYEAPHRPPAAAIAAGWLAARAELDRLAALRADVAEALHHVRVVLEPPGS